MKNRIIAYLVLLGVFSALLALDYAIAQSRVEGIVATNSSGTTVRPVLVCGLDGSGNLQPEINDSLGKRVHGVTTNGGALTNVRPVVAGGRDPNSGLAVYLPIAEAGQSIGAPAQGLPIVGTNSGTARVLAVNGSGQAQVVSPLSELTGAAGVFGIGGRDNSGNLRMPFIIPSGSAASSAPQTTMVGGSDSSNNAQVFGMTSTGAATIAAVTSGSTRTNLKCDASGHLTSTNAFGIHADDTVTRVVPVTSNGTTRVTIGPSGSGGLYVHPITLVFTNTGASTRTVTVSSASTADMLKFVLTTNSGFVLDGRGDIRTNIGEALQFRLDGGTTDVTVSGTVIQK